MAAIRPLPGSWVTRGALRFHPRDPGRIIPYYFDTTPGAFIKFSIFREAFIRVGVYFKNFEKGVADAYSKGAFKRKGAFNRSNTVKDEFSMCEYST